MRGAYGAGAGGRAGAPVAYRAVGRGLLVLLALIGTGYFFFGGGYDRYQGDKLLGDACDACDGVLAKREAPTLLGDGPLKKGDGGNDSAGAFAGRETDERSLRVRCSIRWDLECNAGKPTVEASVAVTVSGVPARGAPDSPFRELYAGMPYGLAPAPLGHGWSGVFATRDDGHRGGTEAMTSVVLDCADTQDDLLVTARVGGRTSPLTTRTTARTSRAWRPPPPPRPPGTGTATRGSARTRRRWGCR